MLANFALFFSLSQPAPTSGKPGSSLPQFCVSLRVVPPGRSWWGPAVLQCAPRAQAPAVPRHPRMALESRQTLRGCP